MVNIKAGNITSVEVNESASNPGSGSASASGSASGSASDSDSEQTPLLLNTTISRSDVIFAGTSIILTCNITVADSVNTSRELLIEWRKNCSSVSSIDYLITTPLEQTEENSYYSELIFPILSRTRDSAVYSCNAVINSTLGSIYVISSEEESDSFNLDVTGMV